MRTHDPKRPLRLGMIGCGLISHAHGRAAQKTSQHIGFVACTSRRRDSAEAWARTYGCSGVYTDHRAMLAGECLDGVVIATWPQDHRAHIEACLAAGVEHILCEKALTTSSEDALALWRRAREMGATVIEGFMYRHHPAMAALSALLERPDSGAADSLYASVNLYDPEAAPADRNRRSWRQLPEMGGGIPYDFLCYPVDAANYFAKSLPLRAYATGSLSRKYDVINRLYGQITYENGLNATVESSRRSSFSQRLQISCAQAEFSLPVAWNITGTAVITERRSPDFIRQETILHPVEDNAPHDGRLVDLPVFQYQLENFAAVIRGQAAPRIMLEESVLNSCVLDALVASFERAEPVEVVVPGPIREVLKI